MAPSTKRPTVSAVLIVKDEEAVLAGCLESVAWADEVVVYDTGSSDGTLALARTFTDHVVEGYWDDDFGAARNRALAHATGDWVLSIDADEVFDGDPEAVRKRLGYRGAVMHTVQVRPRDLGRVRGSRGLQASFTVSRVFRRDACVWEGHLHEQVVPVPGVERAILEALPNVVLWHSGYEVDVFVGKGKSERNVTVSEADLAQALRDGATPAYVAERQANLARSYVAAGRYGEAEETARTAYATGLLTWRSVELLAMSMSECSHIVADVEAEAFWLDAWEGVAENAAWVCAARARMAAERGDAPGVLAALDRVPTTTVNSDQQRLNRYQLAQFEVWALAVVGRHREAVAAARSAAQHGFQPASPVGLLATLGAAGVRAFLPAVRDEDWTEYALQCVEDASAEARTFLTLMHEVRPDDIVAPVAAARLAPVLSLEEATTWAAVVRRAGLAESCPLVAIAVDPGQDPRQRALAGALAWDVYQDERALAGLEQAMAAVAAADEAELLAQLEIVAPGLVSPAPRISA